MGTWTAWIGAGLWLALAASPATPDVSPPGRKIVHTSVDLVPASAMAERRFAVLEVFGRLSELEPGAAYTVRTGPHRLTVFALDTDEVLPVDDRGRPTFEDGALDPAWREAHAAGVVGPGRVPPVALGSPIAKAVHRVRIVAVTDDEVVLEHETTEYFDAGGNPIDRTLLLWTWIGLAAVGIAGLVVLYRRGRRRDPEAVA